MMRLALAAIAALLPSLALAQPLPNINVPTTSGDLQGVAPFVWNGTTWVPQGTSGAGAGAGASATTLVPPTGTPTESTVTCGVTTTALLAAAAATQFILIKNPAAGGTVWVNAAGVAAVAAPPSIDITGGASLLWSPGNGFVPSSALNCIAAVAQSVTLVYK